MLRRGVNGVGALVAQLNRLQQHVVIGVVEFARDVGLLRDNALKAALFAGVDHRLQPFFDIVVEARR